MCTTLQTSIKLQMIELHGNWEWGIALDLHTKFSIPIFNENGEIAGWNTVRTAIGEALYHLKYKKESEEVRKKRVEYLATELEKAVVDLWVLLSPFIELNKDEWRIIGIPPSRKRAFQPVDAIVSRLKEKLEVAGCTFIPKNYKELKNIEDEQERLLVLENAFQIADSNCTMGKNILLIDDLYRSGATLEAATRVLKTKGKAKNVFVITLTKTRTKR